MRRRFLALLLFTASFLPVARAEEPARLSLDEAVEIALRANYDVLRARERLALLGGQIQEVKSQIYPQLGFQSSYQRSYDESYLDLFDGFIPPEEVNDYAVKTTANQLLFSWGKVSTAVEVARESRAQGALDLASAERQVKLSVHQAYYGLLLSRRLVEVAQERLAQRQRQLDVAEKRFAAGVVNEFEVIRARVDVANAKPDLIRARNQVLQAEATLNNLLARDQGAPIEAVGELEYVPLGDLTLDEVVRRAIAHRPELASLRVARDIAEKNVAIARAGDKPQVNLQAEYGYATQVFDHLNPSRERWSAAVVLQVPLFDGWRTRGQVAQATSRMRDVQIATAQLRETITLDAKVALDDLKEAAERIDAASLNIGQAQKALELAETSYRYGVATFLDVTDAQLGLTEAQTNHATALRDYMLAKARVQAVMNEL